MKRFLMMWVLVGTSVAAQASGTSGAQGQPVNPVVAWNRILLSIVRTPNVQPPTIHPTRSFAILHAAIYDAVNAIEQTHAPYLVSVAGASRRASIDAAANTAAHDVLVALYAGSPNFAALKATLDTDLDQLLQVDSGGNQAEGIQIGRAVAQQILAIRSHDHADALPVPYVFGNKPGDYQSTPPTPPDMPKQPQFTHWRFVTPFTVDDRGQFPPTPPPPSLLSDDYARALDQVRSIGVVNSVTATPEQAEIGLFWNGPIQNYWNEIAQTVSETLHMSTGESARLFALLDLSVADGVIAFYDAKYTFNFWRPVTAIRNADPTNPAENPAISPDLNWLPQSITTAPDPSYPGAHAVVSAAAAEVLASVLRRDRFDFDVTSEVRPGVVRSFASFSAAAEEASLSRIFAGQHFAFDQTSGQRLGRQVADFVDDHLLTRIQKPSSDHR